MFHSVGGGPSRLWTSRVTPLALRVFFVVDARGTADGISDGADVNGSHDQAEDRMGMRDVMDATYALHHLAHAHNSLTSADHLGGQDAKSMKKEK